MINLKLKAIASLIDKSDTVLDTCCDHAYLAIYLKQNNLCKEVYASDINCNALDGAKKNILAAKLNITTYLSDGFKNINNNEIDTVVIAGVGTSTVINIIASAPKNINKYIISSNNNLDILRKYLYKKKLYIKKEVIINERNKFYVIMLVTKDFQKENKLSLKFGKSLDKKYYLFLINKEEETIKKIPKRKFGVRFDHKKNIRYLKKLIRKM